MSRRRRFRALLLIAAGCGCCFGQTGAGVAAQTSEEKVCAEAVGTPLPNKLQPSPAEFAAVPANCFALDLYYDKAPGHLQAALVCGLKESAQLKANQKPTPKAPAPYPADPLALTMMFANGEGVPRNTALARRFACEADDGFVEVGAVLWAIDNGKVKVCGTDGSEYGRQVNYLCLGIRQEQVTAELADAYAHIRQSMTPEVYAAWRQLDEARTQYLKAHGAEEPNGNTGLVQAAMEEDLEADRQWLTILYAAEHGPPPPEVLEAGDLQGADQKLNEQYSQALAETAKDCPAAQDAYGIACLSPGELRKAERAWLRSREAWVRFGALRWPQVPADHWRTWLTTQRLAEMGPE